MAKIPSSPAWRHAGHEKRLNGQPHPKEPSDVEQEVQYVAILDYVFLAFCTHLACFLGALFALEGNIVVISNGLGADEATLKIGVNNACRLGGRIANVNSPGTHFFYAGGKVSLQ